MSRRLTEIKSFRAENWFVDNPNGSDVNEEIDWLIARVEQLESIIGQARHRHSSNAYKQECADTCYACWSMRAVRSLPEGTPSE